MVAGTPGGSMWPVGQARQQPPEKEGVPLAHCSGGPSRGPFPYPHQFWKACLSFTVF